MPVTKEDIRTLLNQLQNDPNNRFDFDYFSDKLDEIEIQRQGVEYVRGDY